MFVGVVVENFHKCRETQEKEERALRAEKRSQKMEQKRKSMIFKFLFGPRYFDSSFEVFCYKYLYIYIQLLMTHLDTIIAIMTI